MNVNSSLASAWDAHVAGLQNERRAVRAARDEQIKALYPHMRTFVLKHVDAVLETPGSDPAEVPQTLTLVTPNHSDPAQDHLYAGAFPVLGRNLHWNKHFEELDFATSDGTRALRGHLRMTHSRMRAFGLIDIGGNAYSVEYEVPPQSYTMRIAKDAAYLAGDNAKITWDTASARWLEAGWTVDPVVTMTYGVNGEEVIGDQKIYTFLAHFKDAATGREWKPEPLSYTGYLTRQSRLGFNLIGGTKVPTGAGTDYFPYALAAQVSEFAYDFTGGMVTGQAGYGGTVYGVMGTWVRRPAAGMYVLECEGGPAFAAVHDGALYVGAHRVAESVLDGDTLSWRGLDEATAAAAGLPSEGHLVFSADGSEITSASFKATGRRVSPDEALAIADADASALPLMRASLRHSRVVHADPRHSLTALVQMNQYTVDSHGRYFDVVQQKSMEDFYTILQNYMDQNLRKEFFGTNPPPPLSPALYAIAHVKGTTGTDPIPWYGSLSAPYTACSLSNFSSDPAAGTINGKRAEVWLTQATSGSDVMQAQGPLLYQRRYHEKYDNLEWFLVDQKARRAEYATVIDGQVAKWVADAEASPVGTPEEMAALIKQVRGLGEYAKKNDQYWSFALYTYTTTTGYLGYLQTIELTDSGIDGSEITQRVERTVATLNVLDTTSFFSQEYARLLQLFQLGSVLPQLFDYSADLDGFSYAVEQILKKFVEQYIDSPDPQLREAALALQQNATQDLIDKVLQLLHSTAAVGHGVYEWVHIAGRFQNRFGQLFAKIPALVGNMIAMAGAGALLSFFLVGAVDFRDLSPAEQALVIVGGTNVLAEFTILMLRRGLALGSVWDPQVGRLRNLIKFFKWELIDDALTKSTSAARNWLMSNKGSVQLNRTYTIKEAFAARSLFTANSNQPLGRRFRLAVIGRNLGQFTARLFGSVFAIISIVLTAMALSKENEPLELAANILFMTASCLELVALVGGWAVAGSALAVGGMLVSTIFAVVAVIGVIALVAGIILLAVMWSRPQETPVEKFAKSLGNLYMPYRTSIEYFEVYQPAGSAQRAGVAVLTGGDQRLAMKIYNDSAVVCGPYDATGHSAFYISADSIGRVQIGAPITDAKGVPALYALAVDDQGKIVAKSASGKEASLDAHLLWHTEVVGDGAYEQGALRSAPFKLYTALSDGSGRRRYLDVDLVNRRWLLREGDGTIIHLKMEVVRPAELTMEQVTWYVTEHDQRADPALQVPGSMPRQWSIEPALPEGLEFLPEEGAVRMRKGVDVPPTARATYTLRCTNEVGSISTPFELAVLVPAYDTAAAA